ncbi:MAG TPA: VOC family protein [Parvibaculum sp.]|uniref:VOC family protein n=1 Tax=Parvibaculum sp. TaxID=2024848 RepID=UPI002CAE59F3|nr:VOC family protein [Parvibaculum sp.]HMM13191.1 VOC family protein [Parvibaculum sp.]
MKPALTHIALHVRDLDASKAFYAEFCGMKTVHERGDKGERVAWIAEDGKEHAFVIVMIEGGNRPAQRGDDFTHLGFALASREAVDEIARRGADHLVWPPKTLPYPVGHFCGLADPDGNVVEFSYGQPLGPDADEQRSP